MRPVKTLPGAKVRHLLDGYLVCTFRPAHFFHPDRISWKNTQTLQTRLCCAIFFCFCTGKACLKHLFLSVLFHALFPTMLIGFNLVQQFLSKSLHAMRWRWCRGIYRRYDDSWWLLITTCVEGSAYEGEEKEHLSPLGLSEGQWAFHVSIRHHFLRRPFLQTDKIFKKTSALNEALDFVKTRC